MTKGDFYRDDVERTQRLRTDERRRGRMRRKSTYVLLLLGLLLLLAVSAPSLVCQHSKVCVSRSQRHTPRPVVRDRGFGHRARLDQIFVAV